MIEMSEIRELLETALDGEPAPSLTGRGITARAHRGAIRRRVATVAVGTVAVAGAAGGIFVATAGGTNGATRPDLAGSAMTLSQARAYAQLHAAPASAPSAGDVISPSTLPGLVQAQAQITLSQVDSADLPGSATINMSAAITAVGGAKARGQYLSLMVASDKMLATERPDCRSVSAEDRYFGPCRVTSLPGGGYLVQRSGHTKRGGYAITEADLLRPDGTGVLAQASNQSAPPPRKVVRLGHEVEPVVSPEPPLSSDRLVELVRTLAALKVAHS
jgi:hypothetical protein